MIFSASHRNRIGTWVIWLASKIGSRLRNQRGETICRAFVFPWRGNIRLVGLPRDVQLIPRPMPQAEMTYSLQTICWEQAPAPDFSRLRPAPSEAESPKICHVVICHLQVAHVSRIIGRWREKNPGDEVVIAYGGPAAEFAKFSDSFPAFFVPDQSLRTVDHARERQEYAGVMREAAKWLPLHPEVTHVHLVEWDVMPCANSLGKTLAAFLASENADVAGFGACDLTGTIHPHYRMQIADVEFLAHLQQISLREDRRRILSMLGCSTIWTRDCFIAVSQAYPDIRTYLEIAGATEAHHLGYRVVSMPKAQQNFISFQGDRTDMAEEMTAQGAWMVHPCKKLP